MMMDPLSESTYLDPDYQASRGWPSTARQQAEAGDVHAQLYMAEMALNSESPSIQSTSVRWYEMAADQGNLSSMVQLYYRYEKGDIIQDDLSKACDWMSKIVSMYDDAKNDVQRNAIRDVMHRYGGYLLGLSYTEAMRSLPESLQDATEGLRWIERATDLGHKDAIYTLGNLYMTGQHPKVGFHVDKGMALWKKGAKLGHVECALKVALAYSDGSVPVNPHVEEQWMRVAARLGSNEARVWLSVPEYLRSAATDVARRRLRHWRNDEDVEGMLETDLSSKCSNPCCDRRVAQDAPFESCNQCKSVKYCSTECQLAHLKDGHKSECKNLMHYKEQCKKHEKEVTRRLLDTLELRLRNCHFCKKKAEETPALMRCSKCMVTKYCSAECQFYHWEYGGHEIECAKAEAELKAELKDAQDLLDLLDEQNEPPQC